MKDKRKMYINSIKHHDGDLAEKIKDLSLNHFILYEVFLFYLARNKGSFNLDSDEFQKVYLLLKKKSRIDFKDVIPYLMTLAQLGAWDYKRESNTITSEQLINLSSKFSKGGKKGQQIKKTKPLLETQEKEVIVSQLPRLETTKVGPHKTNSDLVNRLMEFNQQGDHKAFKSILDYERLTTRIRHETITFYLDNIEAFKKAAAMDTGKLVVFRNGYFRIFNEFNRALEGNIDLKPELPEWVKVSSTFTVPVIEQKIQPLENYRQYGFYSPTNGEFNWIGFLRSFTSPSIRKPFNVAKFCKAHTKEGWQEKFNHWFFVDNISGVKESIVKELKEEFNIDSMYTDYEHYKTIKGLGLNG